MSRSSQNDQRKGSINADGLNSKYRCISVEAYLEYILDFVKIEH